jgi:hypothetical protein
MMRGLCARKDSLGSALWLASCRLGLLFGLSACNGQLGYWSFEDAGAIDALDAGQLGAKFPLVPVQLGDAAVSGPAADSGALFGVCPEQDVPTPRCQIAPGVSLPDDATAAMVGVSDYFADGLVLPPGRYRLAYIDGCMKLDLQALVGVDPGVFGWNVHLTKMDASGTGGCWLVGDHDMLIQATPGKAGILGLLAPSPDTAAVLADVAAFTTYAECVAVNCREPVSDFYFSGGMLGVRFGGSPDNSAWYSTDALQGGRGPTFRLTRLDPCP